MSLFGQAFIIMVLGMGLVFLLLFILILCVTLAARFIHFMGWDEEESDNKKPQSGEESALTAAIAVALEE